MRKLARILTATLILATLSTAARADEIVFINGARKSGNITSTAGGKISLKVEIGSGFAETAFALNDVKFVEFTPAPAEAEALQTPAAKDIGTLGNMWKLREPLLGKVRSDAPDVALALARAFLADKSKERAERALALLDSALAKGDLSQSERGALMQTKISALAAIGRIEEAATLMDGMPEIDPAASAALMRNRVELELTRGTIARQNLAALEEEWPKWQLMPEERERHRRLFDQAISSFLYPAALHPEMRDLTASGLFEAAEVFAEQGRPKEASARLEDIVQFYPEPEFLAKATALKEKLKLPNEPET